MKILEKVRSFTHLHDQLDVICFTITPMHFQINSASKNFDSLENFGVLDLQLLELGFYL